MWVRMNRLMGALQKSHVLSTQFHNSVFFIVYHPHHAFHLPSSPSPTAGSDPGGSASSFALWGTWWCPFLCPLATRAEIPLSFRLWRDSTEDLKVIGCLSCGVESQTLLRGYKWETLRYEWNRKNWLPLWGTHGWQISLKPREMGSGSDPATSHSEYNFD